MSNFNPEKPILQKTEDGSHTLYLQNLDETYHSSTGALTESIHVYINHGFRCIKQKEKIKILEVGFGTGMNAVLTYIEAQKKHQNVEYHSLEPFPIPQDLVFDLDMGFITQQQALKMILTQLHAQADNTELTLENLFSFTRLNKTIQEFEEKPSYYDLIYYDAFAPRKQPEMWEKAILQKCVNMLCKDGILITYCANGQFKRDLRSMGMLLSNPPGIGPRREITQARK
ncbi:MAG: tRNA (5-methylaminomethyl-2-thiouridine)(34)-methyltransferase MnmD [Bacteroidetes bacterium]|nr:tRNA (5-methylaminomethyl-2-thiouridine)(34)-methyltransferase MnmD [Bacteroidota bacterium]